MIFDWYTIYKTATGEIVSTLTSDETSIEANVEADCSFISGMYLKRDGYIHDGVFVEYPERTTKYSHFDYELQQWVTDLAAAKDDKWSEIKEARTQHEYGGFSWDGSTFDSDAASQQRIIGASQLAILNPDLEIDWTLADNTVRTLSAQEINAVGVALGQHVNAQYVHARTLRQQISAAQTTQELESIVW